MLPWRSGESNRTPRGGGSGVSELGATGTPSGRRVVTKLALGSPWAWMMGEAWAETAGTHHGGWEPPLRAGLSPGLYASRHSIVTVN